MLPLFPHKPSKPLPSLHELISLQGKSAVITGAAAGIGAATAKRFAEAGADLLLLDINEYGLSLLQEELAPFERAVETHVVDLASKSAIDAFWESLGPRAPDILVNNAGAFPFCEYLETDEAFVNEVFSLNLYSVYWMCQHFIRRCLRQKQPGAIVNISSIEAHLPFKADLAHYSASKAAVIALTRALARDYGGKGVRSNVILPGGIVTQGTKNAAKSAWREPGLVQDLVKFRARLPLGRFGHPDEVARVSLVLASDLASYMNGAVVPVDGGFLSA